MCKEIKLLKGIRYSDDFGSEGMGRWNCVQNELLEVIAGEHKSWFESEIGRAKDSKRPKNRDSFLAECWAAYYLSNAGEWKNVTMNPKRPGYDLDLCFKDETDVTWNVQVKRPIWESEIINNGVIDFERLKKGKNITEVRSVSMYDPLKACVIKASKQLPQGENNILLIMSDNFLETIFHPFLESDCLRASQEHDKEKIITKILAINADLRIENEHVSLKARLIDIFDPKIQLHLKREMILKGVCN